MGAGTLVESFIFMLTQLATVKARLGLADATNDELLTRAIEAVSVRFERECGRTFQRTVAAEHVFDIRETEILPACYPIESVAGFSTKSSELAGWVPQEGVDYLLRGRSVVSLVLPLAPLATGVAKIVYTGGYVLPGAAVGAGQTALPADLESAAVEQVAAWFSNRDKVGLLRYWPSGGTFLVFSELPLLPQVSATLRVYQRWVV